MPKRTHAERPGPREASWLSLRDGIQGLDGEKSTYIELTPKSRRYLKRVPEGGNWRDLPKRQQAAAMGKAFVSWGGRAGFFRRLAWDRPAPALTTRPNCKATMLCHPEALRPLSVLEYAKLQQFPDGWEFFGG